MNTDKKSTLGKLAIAFVLAAFVFFSSSASVLAANQSPKNQAQVEENQLSIENGVNDFISSQERAKLLDPAQIPAQKQPAIDRSDPDSKLLEKVVQMFKDVTDSTSSK